MRPIFTLLFIAACGIQSVSGQVSKIEQKSRENNSPPPSSGGSGSSSGSSGSSSGSSSRGSSGSSKYEYNSDNSSSGSCGSGSTYYYQDHTPSYYNGGSGYYEGSGYNGCAYGCSGCFSIFGDLFAYQKKLVKDKDNPMATSMELMPHIAYGSMQILSYLPRIRATYGIISSDFRITSLNDMSPAEGGTYYTYDWQILQLNLLNDKNVGLYLGGGVMTEHTSTSKYNFFELSSGILIRELGPWSGAFEYRITDRAKATGIAVRSEVGARVNYAFLEKKPFYVNATAGALYQNYYGAVKVTSGIGGFTLVLK